VLDALGRGLEFGPGSDMEKACPGVTGGNKS